MEHQKSRQTLKNRNRTRPSSVGTASPQGWLYLQYCMPLSERLNDIRHGFHRTFWIANTLELFERFAFYGSKAVLAVYLAEKVGLGPQVAGSLVGAFSGVLYFLPVLAGTLVDRYGFRRTLAACFGIFTVGYFLIGLAGL